MDNFLSSLIAKRNSPFQLDRFTQAGILVVDDIEVNAKLMCSILQSAGFTKLETACDGIDALKKTYRFQPDLVLLDIMMPVLDGFGYCERIRTDAGAERMPIVVLTALDEHEARVRALSCGADDFVTKPFDSEELILRVCVHLERYFMFQDMDQMRHQMQMDLENARLLIGRLEREGHSADILTYENRDSTDAAVASASKNSLFL